MPQGVLTLAGSASAPTVTSVRTPSLPSIPPSASNPPAAATQAPAPSTASPAVVGLVNTGGLVDGAVTVRMSLVDASPITLR